MRRRSLSAPCAVTREARSGTPDAVIPPRPPSVCADDLAARAEARKLMGRDGLCGAGGGDSSLIHEAARRARFDDGCSVETGATSSKRKGCRRRRLPGSHSAAAIISARRADRKRRNSWTGLRFLRSISCRSDISMFAVWSDLACIASRVPLWHSEASANWIGETGNQLGIRLIASRGQREELHRGGDVAATSVPFLFLRASRNLCEEKSDLSSANRPGRVGGPDAIDRSQASRRRVFRAVGDRVPRYYRTARLRASTPFFHRGRRFRPLRSTLARRRTTR